MSTTTIDREELAKQVRDEANALAAEVEAAETDEEKSKAFFTGIRKTCIPWLPCTLRDDPEQLYARSYEALFILARANLPLAVGFGMHQYNLASLATLPVPTAPEFENRRKILVDSVARYKSLIAISSFGANIRARGAKDPNVVVKENEFGELICDGFKNFASMATNADILLFSGYVDEETMGMFYCQLAGQKGIEIGPSIFAGAMVLTDTKPLTLKDVKLKHRQVLSTEEWLTYHVSNYGTSWFEALVSAAYLGGASRAIEEVRKFGRSVSHDQEKMLSELDGFILESGRLVTQHRSAIALGQSFGAAAAKYCKAVIAEEPEEVTDSLQEDVMDCSSVIKYTTTKVAQDLVSAARALVGTRSMRVGHPIQALTEQITFGPLHPIIPARHEREWGESFLGEEPYTGLFTSAFG